MTLPENSWQNDIPLQQYEIDHINTLRSLAAECTLFLNKNSAFPLSSPGKLLLVGSGARDTTIGGTGSGGVEVRKFTTCEQGLEAAGFEIVSKDWLEKFPTFKQNKKQEFVNYVKFSAERLDEGIFFTTFGNLQPEVEYDLNIENYVADVAIYVLRRNSGEGTDRRLARGDVYLTNSEIKDILYLNEHYEKFLLVLNVEGVVDLSPVKDVNNILLLSQLGIVTGDILADIVLGKVNPSGKLATTWAAVKDYHFMDEFGGLDNTRYLEGVYVGYRFFDSANVEPLYPFGYGKSYTDFEINVGNFNTSEKGDVEIEVNVKNVGKVDGKEVVQIYVSPPQNNKDKPYQSLVAFKKTKLLKADETETLKLNFKLEDLRRYDEKQATYVLDKGNYIVRVGNSSRNTKVPFYINLNNDVTLQQLKNVGGKVDFQDFSPKVTINDDLEKVKKLEVKSESFETKKVDYDSYKFSYNQNLLNFTEEELAKICVGNFDDGVTPFETHVPGEAAETVLTLDKIKKYVILSDGPAGIRIIKKYGKDDKGIFRLCEDPWFDVLFDYDPNSKHDTLVNNLERAKKVKEVHYQYATAIPTGTSLGQTFNEELLETIGNKVIGEEMDFFGINVWLAPGCNIHRNIRNGRNFEYYSEDPLIAGKLASAIIRGVQKHKNRGVTIKHFVCNNQETNRCNSNSIVSERAMREIYLKVFEIGTKEGKPTCLMTSYNLVNGLHTSERRELVIDVLRSEWGYDGLVMSDWYKSDECLIKISNTKPQNAVCNLLAGNNIQMGGGKYDYDIIVDAVKKGKITKNDLLECAGRVYDLIEKLNQE